MVIIAIEKKNRGISRMYCKVIDKADSDGLGDFMKQTVDFQVNIKTDGWQGYSPLKKDFEHLQQIPAGAKGGNFPEIHRAIMLFESWLRGIYHSVRDLQAYIDEYTYRFSRHLSNASIFDNLITRIVKTKPYYVYG